MTPTPTRRLRRLVTTTEVRRSALPTALGLLTIPFIVKPLDELAEVGMDVTLRKIWGPYLESCEVTYDDDE